MSKNLCLCPKNSEPKTHPPFNTLVSMGKYVLFNTVSLIIRFSRNATLAKSEDLLYIIHIYIYIYTRCVKKVSNLNFSCVNK